MTVKAFLQAEGVQGEPQLAAARGVGCAVARLHDASIVHGDLTTSNIMVRHADCGVVLIDFGLANQNASAEDKAVDLYVLQRAFSSTHPESEPLFAAVLEAYKGQSRHAKATMQRYKAVEARGRKKLAFG